MTKKQIGTAAVIGELQENLGRLLQEAENEALLPKTRKTLESQIRQIISDLGELLNKLDPIRQPTAMFDPSNQR